MADLRRLRDGGSDRSLDEYRSQLLHALDLNPSYIPAVHRYLLTWNSTTNRTEGLKVLERAMLNSDNDPVGAAYAAASTVAASDKSFVEKERVVQWGLDLDPQSFHLHREYAILLEAHGKIGPAISHYEKAIAINPGSVASLVRTCRLKMKSEGDIIGARALAERALSLSPGDPSSVCCLAICENIQRPYPNSTTVALGMLQSVVQRDPNDLTAACYYARMLMDETKDYQTAEVLLRRSLEIDPNHVDSLCSLGDLLFLQKGDVTEAKVLLRKAVHTTGFADLPSINAFCSVLEQSGIEGDKLEQDEVYQKALEVNPQNIQLLLTYGSTRSMMGFSDARKYYERALALNPRDPNCLSMFATYLKKQDSEARADGMATELFRKAAALDPKHYPTLVQYATSAIASKADLKSVLALYRQAVSEDYDTCALMNSNLGQILQAMGKNKEASKYMLKAVALEPASIHYKIVAASHLSERCGDVGRAHDFYKEALALEPDNTKVLVKYGRMTEEMLKDFRSTEDMYRRAIDADPSCVVALCNMGSLLQDVKGDHDGAIAMYRRALELEPSHVASLCNYGTILQDHFQQYEQASEIYEKAHEIDPTHTATMCNYASLLSEHIGNMDKAQSLLRQAVSVDPTDVVALCNLGHMLQGSQRQEAVKLFKAALEADPGNLQALMSYGNHVGMSAEELHSYQNILQCVKTPPSPDDETMAGLEWLLQQNAAHARPRMSEAAKQARKELQRRRDRKKEAEIVFDQDAVTEAERMAQLLLEEESLEKVEGEKAKNRRQRR